MRRFFSWLFQRELKEVLRESVEEVKVEIADSAMKEAEDRIASFKKSIGHSAEDVKKAINEYHEKRMKVMGEPINKARDAYREARNTMVECVEDYLDKAETIDRIVESINKKQLKKG